MEQKIFDAHIHVGYFPRKDGKGGEAYYFSPAIITGYAKRAGITEFIFSSTNAVWDAKAETMHREARELKRLSGNSAHAFFWISGEYFDFDSNLEKLPDIYEGFKLHGGETNWMQRARDLQRIFSIARERRFPVQIHTGRYDMHNSCEFYLPFCKRFSDVNVDLAHGQPVFKAMFALKETDNVYIDTSFIPHDEIRELFFSAPEKVMFGTDFPAPLRYFANNGKKLIQKEIDFAKNISTDKFLYANAKKFLEK